MRQPLLRDVASTAITNYCQSNLTVKSFVILKELAQRLLVKYRSAFLGVVG
jgi:hypothetical protein